MLIQITEFMCTPFDRQKDFFVVLKGKCVNVWMISRSVCMVSETHTKAFSKLSELVSK